MVHGIVFFRPPVLGNGELKLRRPAGADVGRVVIHGKPVARKAELDVDEPDEGVEVEDIEQLAAGSVPSDLDTRRCACPVSTTSGNLVKSVTPRSTDLIMSRIIAMTILRVDRLLRVVSDDESHIRPDNVLHELGHIVVVRLADLVHRGHDHVDLLGELVGIVPGWFVAKY